MNLIKPRSAGHLHVLALALIVGLTTQAAGATQDALPQVYTLTPTGVNLQTGLYNPSFTDLSIGPLALVRGGPAETFGNSGIKHNLAGGLYTTYPGPGGQPLVNILVGGKTYRWIQVSSGDWTPWNPEATGTAFYGTAGAYKMVDRAGTTFQFMSSPSYASGTQVLQYAEYSDGSRLDYGYNSLGLLHTLSSNRGYAIVLDYDANRGVSAACGFNMSLTSVDASTTCSSALLKVGYGYSASGTTYYQTSFTDTDGNVTTYNRDSSGLLLCITLANSPTCRITNFFGDQPGDPTPITKPTQVRKQVMASGAVWLFGYDNNYDHENPPLPGQSVFSNANMIDPLGNETGGTYDRGEIKSIYEPGGKVTQYDLSGSDLVQLTYPEGNVLKLIRDGDRISQITKQAKPGSGLADIIVHASYPIIDCEHVSPKVCNGPADRTDANGNRTDYTYDLAHGGVLTETGPAVGGVRPQTRYTYAQRYAWIETSTGSYVHASTPIWVVTQKSFCKSGAASGAGCAIAGDEVRTTYDYGPDVGPSNLLLRGQVEDATGLALRTCYGYDWQGNRISETKPSANLGACS